MLGVSGIGQFARPPGEKRRIVRAVQGLEPLATFARPPGEDQMSGRTRHAQ